MSVLINLIELAIVLFLSYVSIMFFIGGVIIIFADKNIYKEVMNGKCDINLLLMKNVK